jgi:hypothetical protein
VLYIRLKTSYRGLMAKEIRGVRGTQKPAVVVRTAPVRRPEPKFWEVDLVELLKLWLSDLSVFMRTAVLFIGLSLPVVISALMLWFVQWYRGDN